MDRALLKANDNDATAVFDCCEFCYNKCGQILPGVAMSIVQKDKEADADFSEKIGQAGNPDDPNKVTDLPDVEVAEDCLQVCEIMEDFRIPTRVEILKKYRRTRSFRGMVQVGSQRLCIHCGLQSCGR